jgi:O-methyltransferase
MKLATLKVNTSGFIGFLKLISPPFLWKFLYKKFVIKNIHDSYAYNPHYSPWLEKCFASMALGVRGNTGLKPQSLYTLVHFLGETYTLEGDVLECGVWRGGSAKILRGTILEKFPNRKLYLFDSFEGMEKVSESDDSHEIGDFKDTSLNYVKNFVTNHSEKEESIFDEVVIFKQGWIPETFAGLENIKICFAHVDLDLYQSISDALNFIYPRMVSRGFIVFDEYRASIGYKSVMAVRSIYKLTNTD